MSQTAAVTGERARALLAAVGADGPTDALALALACGFRLRPSCEPGAEVLDGGELRYDATAVADDQQSAVADVIARWSLGDDASEDDCARMALALTAS